jgi:hypothetical protein
MRCNICNAALGAPLFEAGSDQALTSLCELRPGRTRVWECAQCTHLCGEALPDTGAYYETDYRILLDHDDEDQIYETRGADIVYRTDHQVATLLHKVELTAGARLLDYGCAKASTPRRLLASRSDIEVHLFDVSAMYREHWLRFTSPERCAIHQTPPNWQHRFDIITSFFALEHIPAPQATVEHVASLLRDDGVFYGIVPDTFGNVADFVVIDHVNHFTARSLHVLLTNAGFVDVRIDADAHRGALVFTARKNGVPSRAPDAAAIRQRSRDLAAYWAGLDARIRASESASGQEPAAIYGSGFYGAYIASVLHAPERVLCFLDSSPYQQGKTLFDRPVLAPPRLPEQVRVLYIGLNPKIARKVVSEMDWLAKRQLKLVFLDEDVA